MERAWTWWLFGYWTFGYNERSICEFYRSGCIFDYWFSLCEKTRKGENYKHIYSETKAGRSRFFENPGRIRGEIVNIGYFYDTEFDALQWGN